MESGPTAKSMHAMIQEPEVVSIEISSDKVATKLATWLRVEDLVPESIVGRGAFSEWCRGPRQELDALSPAQAVESFAFQSARLHGYDPWKFASYETVAIGGAQFRVTLTWAKTTS